MRYLIAFTICLALGIGGCGSNNQQWQTVGFNVESRDADPQTIAQEYVAPLENIDIWGFSEVRDGQWAQILEQAAEKGENADFGGILGTTGGDYRLLIVYNRDRFRELRHFELQDMNLGGNVRAPLVAHFRFQATGEEFLFVVNHLFRSDRQRRHQQARMLNQWAQKQDLPIVAVGDYNFDWDIRSDGLRRDLGFDYLTQNGVFSWVKPQKLLPTQCSQKFQSILDFVFISQEVKNWSPSAKILYPQPSYCPDDEQKSDHRPVRGTFKLP
ncbi:endonuclease/exonuclease/phosphatase family protein [Geitlerinema sp. PCC 9228]|jgi:endonuclease/exonuclease/phosphatase family metal-dependent hydrolase|uniref:endonuclease/exonuclease/phosphatase family protein n=1 Tax=Geitlerinema sp. PCC 9228 TaxID=111611 RepID=UPI0008F9950B|nr:endonuclease/exonuclease/phosphatase family protein [Geitlerinema sp. PCC 9228]